MLLKTKLHPPKVREGTVERQRLLQQLDTPQPLTVIQAPAGYGKTTLVRQWLESRNASFAWVSLDSHENDPNRFWRYVAGALDQLREGLGATAIEALNSPESTTETAVTALLNSLCQLDSEPMADNNSLRLPIWLVLDDFHTITNNDVLQGFSWFLDQLPEILQVAITTRTHPDIGIARRRVRNTLIELNAPQLAFSPEETQRFFHDTMHQAISAEASQVIQEKTAGWAAALQLAALSNRFLKAPPNARLSNDLVLPDPLEQGSNLIDYLKHEVLSSIPHWQREFLLRVCFLPRFSAALCEAIFSGSEAMINSHKIINELEQQNLFIIQLDKSGQWFRLHHLFADALQQIALQEDAQAGNKIQQQAAQWFLQQDLPEDALVHLFALQAWDQAAAVIEPLGFARMMAGHNENLEWWLAQLPDAYLKNRPKLSLIKAWGLFATPRFIEAEQYLAAAEAALANTPQDDDPIDYTNPANVTDLNRQIAIFRTQLARIQGDTEKADYYSKLAFDQSESEYQALPSAAQMALGLDAYATSDLIKATPILKSALQQAKQENNSFCVLATSMVLAQNYFQQALAEKALQQCRIDRQWLLDRGQDPSFVDCWQNLVKVEILRELQQHEAAEAGLAELHAYAQSGAPPQHVSSIALIEISFLAQQGNLTAIEPLIAKMESILAEDQSQYAHFTPDANLLRAKYAILQHDFVRAEQLLAGSDNFAGSTPYCHQMAEILSARVLAHKGNIQQALEILERVTEQAMQGNCKINVVRCMLAKVVVLVDSGARQQAENVLMDTLKIAAHNFQRTILDEHPVIGELLNQFTANGITGWWADVADVETSHAATLAKPRVLQNAGEYVETLTTRETEILRWIAQGMSNQQIADQLEIALATTKVHIRNIFEKLGVKRRTQAVSKARELDLIQL